MPWWKYYTFLAILCLSGYTKGTAEKPRGFTWNDKKANSDIIFDKDPMESVAGSGGRMIHVSDDEDLVESGSGSGSGMEETSPDGHVEKTTELITTTTTMTTVRTTTSRPSTVCEKLRQASWQLSGKHVPRCLPNGEYDSLQCQGHPGIGSCWCSDLEGRDIPGSHVEAPDVPNCDTGKNLQPCVHQLVQHVRSKVLGNFRPKCTSDGQFDRIQCQGSMCFCVDESSGSRVSGTEVHIPDSPNCDDDSADVNVPDITTGIVLPNIKDTIEDNINIDEDVDQSKNTLPEENNETIDLDLDIGGSDEKEKETEVTKPTSHEDNLSERDREVEVHKSDQEGHHSNKLEKAIEIMTQPGVLAGIIGGSVVLLLCVVLLVMFIVYRMRKKDEGSYPLDEPRKAPNYNYVRAPEKEFYA